VIHSYLKSEVSGFKIIDLFAVKDLQEKMLFSSFSMLFEKLLKTHEIKFSFFQFHCEKNVCQK